MPDTTKSLIAVDVAGDYDAGDLEYFRVGHNDVTAIEWGTTPGLHCDMPTVQVFRNGELHSEHPYAHVRGVYYQTAETEKANA